MERLFWNGSRAYATGLARLAFGFRPVIPWLSYDATRILERRLSPGSSVLEFGSGMSTLWFARRAGFVRSVEGCEAWYQKVRSFIKAEGIQNVDYILAVSESDYVMAGDAGGRAYDMVIVDGDFRSECVRHAVKWLKRPGILYLDNSDKDSGPDGGDIRAAEELALDLARRMHGSVQHFTDFAPTQLTPNQGLMISIA